MRLNTNQFMEKGSEYHLLNNYFKDYQHTEVVLVHCNIVINDYQQDSRVLFIFFPNKSFGQLLDISPKNYIFLKAFNSEFSYIEVWLTDQNSKPLDIKDKINIILVIN